jgi:hypothetical protein
VTEGVRLGVSGEGYTVVHGPEGERFYVHRLVAVAHYEPRRVVRCDIHHRDGVKCHNAPENLSPRRPWEHRTANLRNGASWGEP